MRHWNTGDQVTDCILNQLEAIDTWVSEPDPQSVHQLLTIVINAETMLPSIVKKHFHFPNPYVGNDHERRNQDYRNDLTNKIIEANRAGLDSADADPTLKRGGGADLSDRPRSQGEVILEMLAAFEATRSTADFHRLYAAVSPTTLQSRIRTIEMLMKRKKPYGNQSPEMALHSELYRLRSEASRYHFEKARGYP